jgi:hypothetical protein
MEKIDQKPESKKNKKTFTADSGDMWKQAVSRKCLAVVFGVCIQD